MAKSIIKKIPAIILCLILCVCAAMFAVACDDTEKDETNKGGTENGSIENGTNNGGSGNTEGDGAGGGEDGDQKYYFEAEYTDLTDITSDRGSGTSSGKDLITNGDRAHNGQYVIGFNIADSTITYTITSEAAATVKMSLLICGENTAGTIDPELLIIKVNGTAVSYPAAAVKNEKEKVSAIKTNILFDEVEICDIDLIAGENTITLTVGTKSGTGGNYTYGINLDALVLTSTSKLSWNPIDPDTFYPDF